MKRSLTFCNLAAACVLLVLALSPVRAVLPDEVMSDPAKEARARTLSRELRCMVCQNQSIDDSDAPLAHDLRVLVRERLQAGDSDTMVIDYLTARYGEFVLLRPRFAWSTAALWLAPAIVLLAGAFGFFMLMRRNRKSPALVGEPALTQAEQDRVTELLKSE